MKCNKCGHQIAYKGEIQQEDFLKINKSWGYFSNKDGMNHQFILCEACYDKLVDSFVIPATVTENRELL